MTLIYDPSVVDAPSPVAVEYSRSISISAQPRAATANMCSKWGNGITDLTVDSDDEAGVQPPLAARPDASRPYGALPASSECSTAPSARFAPATTYLPLGQNMTAASYTSANTPLSMPSAVSAFANPGGSRHAPHVTGARSIATGYAPVPAPTYTLDGSYGAPSTDHSFKRRKKAAPEWQWQSQYNTPNARLAPIPSRPADSAMPPNMPSKASNRSVPAFYTEGPSGSRQGDSQPAPRYVSPAKVDAQDMSMAVAASAKSDPQQRRRGKNSSEFSEQEDHLLIFLKEVKRFKWSLITTEFQKYYPERVYHILQSKYTTRINRRDRSQDPSTLNLPAEWAAEATIDWASVHADNPGPRDRPSAVDLRNLVQQPIVRHHTTEQDNSPGTDSGARQVRPRRAPRVDYDIRKRLSIQDQFASQHGEGEIVPEYSPDEDSPARSHSPPQKRHFHVPLQTHTVINEPLDMDFDVLDASIALVGNRRPCDPFKQTLPYLTASQRRVLQSTPEEWGWDQLASRDWQGLLLHVDFTTTELGHVERAFAKLSISSRGQRHSTQRRRLRAMLRNITDSKLLKLESALKQYLPARDADGIAAFLVDVQVGQIAEAPQILRLSAARPQKFHSTLQRDSQTSFLRQRQLGMHSRRGWKTATTTLTYQVKNRVMDTLGPRAAWTGASSDVHTVAWSPDGERFAAGAITVTDADSLQYNRPNNLLFGSLPDNKIHELAEHATERKKTESGANSSHAMFVSQDPRVYATITSVAFAPSGKLAYSAGYDNSVCVWDLSCGDSQPSRVLRLAHKAEVELMVVNHNYNGMLATAAKRSDGGAPVKLITLDEDALISLEHGSAEHIRKQNFYSDKAVSRADLRILPQALEFEPQYGNHLLAGFGANARHDDAFDTNGDICFWDVETLTQIPIHGSSRNVFDIAFNPKRRYMPLFAAGCVANGKVNRGTRSVVRLYDEKSADKYTCAVEIECRALDMNDVVWSPHDEHFIAAGCTDGRVYVWDLRKYSDPMAVLSHGRSLMPLQDGISHERTDTGVRFLSWGENATRLYSGSSDGVVKVWDTTRSAENTFVKDVVTLDSGIMAGKFSPDYTKLVLGEVNGSVNVLETGREDCSLKETSKFTYIPYAGFESEELSVASETVSRHSVCRSGIAEADSLLLSQKLQVAPMGNLPITQVVQGPNYDGPYDRSVDAPCLREQALEFQLGMVAQPGPQCTISSCKDSVVRVTSEEIGDSGRSVDRIPDELRRQWTAMDIANRIMPGKSRCTNCGRPALPLESSSDAQDAVLCERCAFRCFRCRAVNHVTPETATLVCKTCAGAWEIGALGYECIQQPLAMQGGHLHIPSLRRYGRDLLEQMWDEQETTYVDDEMNALTGYYFSLAID
ncbi:hypothetical protein ACEQ8H_000575 [Pleosporales sp. CAS-2024a]